MLNPVKVESSVNSIKQPSSLPAPPCTLSIDPTGIRAYDRINYNLRQIHSITCYIFMRMRRNFSGIKQNKFVQINTSVARSSLLF